MKERLNKFLHSSAASDILSSLLAIVAGLIVGFIILLISKPSQALGAFMVILTSGFGDLKSVGQVLYYATPIIMTGLSVGFANKTGLFNIGASGQFTIGGFAAIYVGVKFTFLPGFLHCLVALLAAMIAGALWGCLPGFLKAKRNVNEVIACIMMNYIGMYLVNYLITKTVYDSLRNQSMRVASAANLPKLGLDTLFPNSSANSGILVAIIMAVIIYIVLQKTKFGYEIKAVGYNRDAAQYAGMNEQHSIVYSMAIAGALAGLGGALLYLAGSGARIDVVDTLAAEGFNGIPVALLGLNNPIGIIFSGLLISYLKVGGFNMQLYDFSPEVIEIIIAIIIYFSAFALLLKNIIQQIKRHRRRVIQAPTGGDVPLDSEGKAGDVS